MLMQHVNAQTIFIFICISVSLGIIIIVGVFDGGTILHQYGNDKLTFVKEILKIFKTVNKVIQKKVNEDVTDSTTLKYFEHQLQNKPFSKSFKTTQQVIEENQRIMLYLLDKIIWKSPYVMLMDIPRHSNKGDSAITIGEVMIIKKNFRKDFILL